MRFILILLLAFFTSCGIPDYGYVEAPSIVSGSGDSGSFVIKMPVDTSLDSLNFEIYGRYYDTNSQIFTAEEYELSLSKIRFLQNKGYIKLGYLDVSTEIEKNIENVSDGDLLTIEKYYGTDQYVNININSQALFLSYTVNNTDSITHKIGDFTTAPGLEMKEYLRNQYPGLVSIINIEFAIIAKGVNISSVTENISSAPLYIGSFDIQLD